MVNNTGKGLTRTEMEQNTWENLEIVNITDKELWHMRMDELTKVLYKRNKKMKKLSSKEKIRQIQMLKKNLKKMKKRKDKREKDKKKATERERLPPRSR